MRREPYAGRTPRGVSLPAWIARYARVSPPAGAYLAARCMGFPGLPALERLLPRAGRILDLGCGYGLLPVLCADRSPEREVAGIDLLGTRVAVGREVLRRHGGPGNVRLTAGDLAKLPDGEFDAICLAHVLLYRPLHEQRAVLARCRERLAPGGLLLLAETVGEPAWKARLARVQERIVVGAKVRLCRWQTWRAIAPAGVHLWDPAALRDFLGELGLRVRSRPFSGWSYLSHHLFIAQAEGATSARAASGPVSLRLAR